MTPEDAKHRADILNAFAEGKTIQYRGAVETPGLQPVWADVIDFNGGFRDGLIYRVKPTPALRPWTYEEIIDHVGCLIRVKSSCPADVALAIGMICGVDPHPLTVWVAGVQARMSPESLLELYECRYPGPEYAGWSPCGVKA